MALMGVIEVVLVLALFMVLMMTMMIFRDGKSHIACTHAHTSK